jgi:hypothetical protein
MEGYCTCGAKLAEDALFCHRCGRPAREGIGAVEPEPAEEAARVDAAPAVEPPLAPPAEETISFRNRVAVRVGLISAALVQLVMTLATAAGGPLMLPVVLVAGGWYSTFLYRRRSGVALNSVNGARMGWITGVFTFVITTVFFTAAIALMMSSGELLNAYRRNAESMGMSAETVEKLQDLMKNPGLFGFSLVAGLFFQFVLQTFMSSVGGFLSGLGRRGQTRV